MCLPAGCLNSGAEGLLCSTPDRCLQDALLPLVSWRDVLVATAGVSSPWQISLHLFPAPLWPLSRFMETSGFPPGIAQATGNQKCSLRLTYVPIFQCCLTSPSLMSRWELLWGGHFQESYRLLLVCPGPCPTSPPQTSPGPGDLLLASFTSLSLLVPLGKKGWM